MNPLEESEAPSASVNLLAIQGPRLPVIVVFVSGAIDAGSHDALFSTLEAAAEMQNDLGFKVHLNCSILDPSAVVNLCGVSSISDWTLIELGRRRDRRGHRLRLVVNERSILRRRIALLGLIDKFDVRDSLAEALVRK